MKSRQAVIVGPAGSIVSTAHDMALWMMFHLKGGEAPTGAEGGLQDAPSRGRRRTLIDRQRLQETYVERNAAFVQQMSERGGPVKPHSPVSEVHVAYDLGWMTSFYRGKKLTERGLTSKLTS